MILPEIYTVRGDTTFPLPYTITLETPEDVLALYASLIHMDIDGFNAEVLALSELFNQKHYGGESPAMAGRVRKLRSQLYNHAANLTAVINNTLTERSLAAPRAAKQSDTPENQLEVE